MEDESNREERDRLIKMLQQILDLVQSGGASAGINLSDWWDDAELKANLRISDRTIYRRRKDGTFKFHRIGGRYHYYAPDILKIRDRFLK